MNDFDIQEFVGNRERLMPLLLIGDEQECMVKQYINDGRVFVAYCGDVPVAVALVLLLEECVCEIKNLAVAESFRRRGLGSRMMEAVESACGIGHKILVGTGEAPRTLSFYRQCGYEFSHRVPNFFVDNYDHPVIDDGVLLVDMVYLVKYT